MERVKFVPGRAIRIRHYPRKFQPIVYLESSDEEEVKTNPQTTSEASVEAVAAEKPVDSDSTPKTSTDKSEPLSPAKNFIEVDSNSSSAPKRRKLRTNLNF